MDNYAPKRTSNNGLFKQADVSYIAMLIFRCCKHPFSPLLQYVQGVSKSMLLILSAYVNKTENIGGM